LAIGGTTLLERSYSRTTLHVVGISLGYVGGFCYEDYRRAGGLFGDLAAILLLGVGYLVPAMIVTWFLQRPSQLSPKAANALHAFQFDVRALFVAMTLSAIVIPAVIHGVEWLSVGTVYLCWILLVAAFWVLRALKQDRMTSGETIVLCIPMYVAAILAIYRYSVTS
jgi:hypothetical protein